MKSHLLGIDIGTSGVKVLLMNKHGSVVGESFEPYGVSRPKPLWSEQDPVEWWAATTRAIHNLSVKTSVNLHDIAAIGLTGQMHGLVILDRKGRVIRPCIMWNDQRTAAECAMINRRVGLKRLLAINGKPALTGFTAGKILWVRRHEPASYRKIAHVLLPKDYIRYCFSGECCTDVADASGTNLFDVAHRTWSDTLADILGIPYSFLPGVSESVSISSYVSPKAARHTGLAPGTPIVSGAGDQAAQALGSAAVRPGVISITIGTSGVVFVTTAKYRYDPHGRLHAYCHAVPGRWHLMGVMLAAGDSLKWLRDTFGKAMEHPASRKKGDPYERLLGPSAQVPAGAEGLIFLPYLSGERTPHADPNARGVFFGLTMRHTMAHMTRAVLEGVGFGLRDGLELVSAMDLGVTTMYVTGGGAHSELWCQILADIIDHDLTRLRFNQGAAFGAAIIAGVGSGLFRSIESTCDTVVKPGRRFEPSRNAKKYEQYYQLYRSLYPRLKKNFADLACLNKDRCPR